MIIKNDGNVGIGTSKPGKALDIKGVLTFEKDGTSSSVIDRPMGGHLFFKRSGGTSDITFQGNGNVGIGTGTTSASSRLHVANGCITGTTCSDRRLKMNIRSMPASTSMLKKVAKLKAASYQWKTGKDEKTYIGLIAQDVEKVLPEIVSTPSDGSVGKGLSCNGLNAVTIEAVKELKFLVDAQQRQIAGLRIEIVNLRRERKRSQWPREAK